MRARDSRYRNLMQLSEKSLELVSVFKEAIIKLYAFSLFDKAAYKYLETI